MFSPRRTYSLDGKKRRGTRRSGGRAWNGSQNALLCFYLGAFLMVSSLIIVFMSRWAVSPSSAQAPKLDTSLLRASEAKWDWALVHIVNTRFMQEQGQLTTLARARLELFAAFCLPTMIHQSSQHFLWIIKVDPNLDHDVRNEMVEYLAEYPNFFLVGSNVNYQVGSGEAGTWRDGKEGEDVLGSPIHTGDVDLLLRAYAARNSNIVLESRLDADDGLHKDFVKYVQQTALESFFYQKDVKWMYWCSRRHLEWYPDSTIAIGRLNPVEHSKLCITPGITVGFSVGVQSSDVPEYAHDKLYKAIEANGGCGLSRNIDCINLVEKLPMVAVRSRTLTSAGQKDTFLDPALKRGSDYNNHMWSVLEKSFFVSPKQAEQAGNFMHKNSVQIAKENLQGQCTLGHSCKFKSLEQLQRLLEMETEAKNLLSVPQSQYHHRG